VSNERQNNRERYPDVAAFVDDCRRYFGEARVVNLEPRDGE